MPGFERVCISVGRRTTAFEIFAAYKADVDIDVGKRDRAAFLEIEIKVLNRRKKGERDGRINKMKIGDGGGRLQSILDQRTW
jgi:hypothetical protein